MFLLLMLAACTLAFGALVYRYDLYDREPAAGILTVALLGGVFMWLSGKSQVAIVSGLGASAALHWTWVMALTAGLIEEAGKFAAAALLALGARRWFNDPLDGLIYGSLAGLGAAVHESWIVLGLSDPGGLDFRPTALPASEPVRLMGHLVMGGLTCAGVGAIARNRAARTPAWLLPVGFAAGAGLHVLWDVLAFTAADKGRMSGVQTAVAITLMLTGFVLYRGLVGMLAARSARAFGACRAPI